MSNSNSDSIVDRRIGENRGQDPFTNYFGVTSPMPSAKVKVDTASKSTHNFLHQNMSPSFDFQESNLINHSGSNSHFSNINRSQAVQMAVDAHATRLLRAKSPPEACVDSSLGPYVTSILRRALPSTSLQCPIGSQSLLSLSLEEVRVDNTAQQSTVHSNSQNLHWNKTTIHEQIPDYESLIELLESQCQMSSEVANDVVWNIAIAIMSGEVSSSDASCGNANRWNNFHYTNRYENNSQGNSISGKNNDRKLGRGSRSLSVGAEQEYDVNFLGQILQDAMGNKSREGEDKVTIDKYFNENCEISVNNEPQFGSSESQAGRDENSASDVVYPSNSAFTLKNGLVRQQRHVSFDETHLMPRFSSSDALLPAISDYVPTTEDAPISHSSFSTYSNNSVAEATRESAHASTDSDISHTDSGFIPADLFDPLEGVLDILNYEDGNDEDNGKDQLEKENNHSVHPTEMSGENSNQGTPLPHDGTASATPYVQNPALPQCHPVKNIESNCMGISYPDPSDDKTSGTTMQNSSKRASKHSGRKNLHSSKKEEEANDLAAALFFRSTRPRSNSLMDQRHNRSSPPMLRPLSLSSSSGVLSAAIATSSNTGSGSPVPSLSNNAGKNAKATLVSISSSSSATSTTSVTTTASTHSSPFNPVHDVNLHPNTNNSAEILSTTEILLTLNSNLGQEAASLASELTNGDLNLAQYLIEAARSDTTSGSGGVSHSKRRPRICRHELHGTCYRSDCPFSHDLGGVTCLFWLRGRCRSDGSSCRFLHGFGERLLDGICEEYLIEQQAKMHKEEQLRDQQVPTQHELGALEVNKPIATANLLDHNQWAADRLSSSLPKNTFSFMTIGESTGSSTSLFNGGCWTSSLVNR